MPTSRYHICSRLAEVQMNLQAIREFAEAITVGGCEKEVLACTELPARANAIILTLMRELGADPGKESVWDGPDERPRRSRRRTTSAQ